MNNKDFKIYREGHLEGYGLGLKDGNYINLKLKIWAEAFSLGILVGIGLFTTSLILLKIGGVL